MASADLDALLANHPLPELHHKRIFATGCTGFFGYWLLAAISCLNRHGASIEVIALSRNPNRFVHQHPSFALLPWLTFVTGNVRDFRIDGLHFDYVIHAATDTSPEAAARPDELFSEIVTGTQCLLSQIAPTRYEKLLLVSSGAVYGEQTNDVERFAETMSLPDGALNARNSYAVGKRMAETLCGANATNAHPAAVIARCFAFVGPFLPQHLAPTQFVSSLMRDGEIVIQGDGTPLRSYLDAADMALWLLTMLARGEPGRIYNVGGTEAVSISQLATTILEALNPAGAVTILGAQSDGPRHRYLPDTRRARDELQLKVWTPLTHSVRRMAQAMEIPR